MDNLKQEHQAFIEGIDSLTVRTKESLLDEFKTGFDFGQVLGTPDYGKSLLSELQLRLVPALQEAIALGNIFGAIKEKEFNARG
jgi:hypothetical protein